MQKRNIFLLIAVILIVGGLVAATVVILKKRDHLVGVKPIQNLRVMIDNGRQIPEIADETLENIDIRNGLIMAATENFTPAARHSGAPRSPLPNKRADAEIWMPKMANIGKPSSGMLNPQFQWINRDAYPPCGAGRETTDGLHKEGFSYGPHSPQGAYYGDDADDPSGDPNTEPTMEAPHTFRWTGKSGGNKGFQPDKAGGSSKGASLKNDYAGTPPRTNSEVNLLSGEDDKEEDPSDWPSKFFYYSYNRKKNHWPPGIFSRLKQWGPGFYTSGLMYTTRPDADKHTWPTSLWVKNNGNYYFINQMSERV